MTNLETCGEYATTIMFQKTQMRKTINGQQTIFYNDTGA